MYIMLLGAGIFEAFWAVRSCFLQTIMETAAYSGTALAGTSFFSFTLRGGRFLSIITIHLLLSAGI